VFDHDFLQGNLANRYAKHQRVVTYNWRMSRQRVFPIGTTATERVEASLKALVERGGARKTFRLKPEANAALKQLQRMLDAKTETEAVELAILTMRDSMKGAVAAVTRRSVVERAKAPVENKTKLKSAALVAVK
jgi:hypothetical protein